MRDIVCDSLSGIMNPIAPTAANESKVIGNLFLTLYSRFPGAIEGYYSYMIKRIIEAGGQPWFGPDVLAFCDPGMTIGDLVTTTRNLTT